MVEVLMFLGALVPTLLVGIPLALALSKPGALRARAARDKHVPRAKVEVGRAYVPLDLGPDPVHWPSERAWPSSTFRPPDWPSASWNDEHFGAGRKKSAALHEPVQHVPEPRRSHRGPAPRRPVAELVLQQPEPPPAPILVNELGSALGFPNTGAPGREEIEHLIEQLGLAGTVQKIIDRTGWDFRQAAQHLARTRQQR